VRIRPLREFCRHVYSAADHGKVPRTSDLRAPAPLPAGVPAAPLPKPVVEYQKESALIVKLHVAMLLRGAVVSAVTDVFRGAAAGHRPDFAIVDHTVSEMKRGISISLRSHAASSAACATTRWTATS
jgi:hypothetical protein